MTENAKTPRAESGASQEVSAASGSTPATVPQRRAHGQWPAFTAPDSWPEYGSPEFYAADPFGPEKRFSVFVAAEQWRLQGLALEQLDTVEWYVATFGDARRLAAQIIAANNRIRGFQEIREARRTPHPTGCTCHGCKARHIGANLHATPGWPPVAIPGKPGRYLHPQRHQEAA